jgi:hypothetical protein
MSGTESRDKLKGWGKVDKLMCEGNWTSMSSFLNTDFHDYYDCYDHLLLSE